jgi:hypothetical protein
MPSHHGQIHQPDTTQLRQPDRAESHHHQPQHHHPQPPQQHQQQPHLLQPQQHQPPPPLPHQVTNEQPPRTLIPAAQLSSSLKSGGPSLPTPTVTQKASAQKPAIQQQGIRNLSNQDLPPHSHPPVTPHLQVQVIQQPLEQLNVAAGGSVSSGMKRRPTSDLQDPKMVAKKTKVVGGAANPGSPPAAGGQSQHPPTGQLPVDNKLKEEATSRTGGIWPGVPNLVVRATPVTLRSVPVKRYVVLATSGGRDPLFPKSSRGWAPAEVLGNHLWGYSNAKSDLDRQIADIRLDFEKSMDDIGQYTPTNESFTS